MIAIVDYGLGNIKAIGNIYERLGVSYKFARTASDLRNSTHIVLPGVGAFDFAIKRLNESGMRETLDKLVLEKKLPVIGICVGMQIMAKGSEEGNCEGLGWFDTEVVRIKEDGHQYPLPHMGWNNIELVKESLIFKRLDKKPRFYFLHSYHFEADYKHVVAVTQYSYKIGCILNKENIYGIQCHPEKSHHNGVGLLNSFSEV